MHKIQKSPRNLPEQNSHDVLLINAEEFANLLRVSKRQIWRLRSRGDLIEPIKIGSVTRWPLDMVRAWITAGCPRPNAHSDKTNCE